MKIHYLILSVLVSFPLIADASLFGNDCPEPVVNGSGVTFDAVFTPDSKLAESVIKEVESAKHDIKIAAHRFASKQLALTLLNTARTNREVKIILDKNSNDNGYSDARFFITMNNPPHFLKNYDNQYQEYIIIDDSELIIGNISSLPEVSDENKNAANVLIIHNAGELVKKYSANWQKLWDQSEVMLDKKK